jgi:ubiquinone/menaquinone biosynthesis C-methylase UbiE
VQPSNEIERLKKEYRDWERRLVDSDVYSLFNPAHLFTIQQRQRVLVNALKKHKLANLQDLSIFEMGCGAGGVLTEYLNLGAMPEDLFGIDLIFDRLRHGHHILRSSGIANADGQTLPFPSQSFDLVLQSTALSSILDGDIRRNVSLEMLRVLKPTGVIISYDFWLNPTNPQTYGIRPSEIRRLFPKCEYEFHKITLAPPLARRLVPLSWELAVLLERLLVFNTHYMVLIFPKRESSL